MLQSLILIDALSSACWEKEEYKKKSGTAGVTGIFLRYRLLAVLCGIFVAVRCN
jgi:hypothetical protein